MQASEGRGRRWSGIYGFRWAPILTFNSRREAALRWLEDHVDVVAYMPGDTQFGVAVSNRNLRLVVKAGEFDLLLGGQDVDPSELRKAAIGVLTAMRPRQLAPRGARVVWSHDLDGEYDKLRKVTAGALSGPIEGAEAYDFSALMDVRSPGAQMQVEYGIVNRVELFSRLTKATKGRLRAAEMPPVSTDPASLPLTSLFADVTWITRGLDASTAGPAEVEDMWEFINARILLVNSETSALTRALRAWVTTRGGDDGELSRGA